MEQKIQDVAEYLDLNANKSYCYVWGKKDEDLDKSDPKGGIYKHFDSWETNQKRCPLYLAYIHKVDQRWPKIEEEWVDFMHILLVYSKIRDFINKHGFDKIKKISEKFAYFKEHGYNTDEAMTANLSLIIR